MTKEHSIQNACIDLLEIHGFEVIRVNSGKQKAEYTYKTGERKGTTKTRFIHMAKTGTSDIIACSPRGEFMALEVKAPGNEPTEAQYAFLRRIAENKGIDLWCDDPADLADWLKKNNYSKWE